MPKSKSNQHRNLNSQPTLDTLARRPIHRNIKDLEEVTDEDEEEEINEDDFCEENFSRSYKKLYPDLLVENDFDTEKLLQRSKPHQTDFKIKKEHILPKKTVKPENSSSSISNYIFFFLLLIGSLICYLFYPYFGGQTRAAAPLDVTQLIEDMQNHFKEQQSETFRLVKIALMKVVNVKHEPTAPAIITLVANVRAKNTAAEFAGYLAKTLAPEKYLRINESIEWRSDPDGLKFKIDNEIKSKLEHSSLNVVIVDNLHNIPIGAAMIFHGYCDHDSAPFKRAVFLFIVPSNEIIPENADSKYLDTVAMNRLRSIWRSATDDVVDSLITRITVTVVNIR